MGDCKIGLALGGGSARGWAHIGVLKVLNEAGIYPDIIAGTSIGAVVGGCYVAGELPALERFALQLTRRKVLGFLDFNFSGSGLITGQRLCDILDTRLKGIEIEALSKRFVAVATEIGTGHEIWLSRGRLVDAMRASYAMPGIFRPVPINGRWLFDGALVNPVPVSVCRALGARYVIAVSVNWDSASRGTLVPHVETAVSLEEEAVEREEGVIAPYGRAMRKLLQRQFFGRTEKGPGISTRHDGGAQYRAGSHRALTPGWRSARRRHLPTAAGLRLVRLPPGRGSDRVRCQRRQARARGHQARDCASHRRRSGPGRKVGVNAGAGASSGADCLSCA